MNLQEALAIHETSTREAARNSEVVNTILQEFAAWQKRAQEAEAKVKDLEAKVKDLEAKKAKDLPPIKPPKPGPVSVA